MNSHGNRARLGGVLVAVAAVLALIALPGIASGRRGHDGPAPAGTIQSFDQETHVLTIDLTEGGSIAGLVTRRTHVRCDNGRHRGRHGLRHNRRGKRGDDATTSSRRGDGDETTDDHGDHSPGEDDHPSEEVESDDDNDDGDDEADDDSADEDDHGDHQGHRCGFRSLTEGATVKYAVLVLVDGKAIYKEIALPKQAPPPPEEGEEEGEEEAEEAPSIE
jgi:hypothetical protein